MLSSLLLFLATSFSMDATSMLSTAADMFNNLWPIFGILVGITIGLGLLSLIAAEIRKVF